MSFDYDASMAGALEELKKQANYRIFAQLERHRDNYPIVTKHEADGTQKQVVVWCSNDYLGMGTDERVKKKVQEAVARYGNGTGGTRNISGTHQEHFFTGTRSSSAPWQRPRAAFHVGLCGELHDLVHFRPTFIWIGLFFGFGQS